MGTVPSICSHFVDARMWASPSLLNQVMHYDEDEEVAGLLGVRFKKKNPSRTLFVTW